jgi:hypothetical protein
VLAKKARKAGRTGRGRRTGVVLMAAGLLALASAPAALGADRIYWGNGGNDTISFANLDGSGGGGELDLSGSTPASPRGLAIDVAAGRIYWANQESATISYANLDGSGGGGELNISGAPASKPHGLAIDPAAGKIYWANDDNTIAWANLDGSGGGPLNISGATPDSPYGAAIDPAAGRIYWANRGTSTISYANLDGSGGGGELNLAGSTPNDPHGVVIDTVGGRVYWANVDSRISYANLDGSGGGGELNVTGATERGAVGMAIDPAEGRIYWGNLGNDSIPISYASLDNSGGGGNLNVSGSSPIQARFPVILRAPSGAGAPQIAGHPSAGSALTCSQGTWAPDLLGSFLYRAPQNFFYRWLRGDNPVKHGTGASYTPRRSGSYSCRVIATNLAGATVQTSAPLKVGENPKCKRLRKKGKRQKRGLAAATGKKRSHIQANMKHLRKRLKKVGCK